ncbi:hypothetical protein ACHWQZ_G015553 [Mnemiopsis leidyi]
MNYLSIFLLCSLLSGSRGNFSGFDATRSTLENIAFPFSEQFVTMENGTSYMGRQGTLCYGDELDNVPTSTTPKTNNFLDMVNFMEFIQQTNSGDAAKTDASNYYKVAEAAMTRGNTFVAQENMARALGAIASYNRRKRRNTEDGSWSASDLFDQLRNSVGEEKFKEVLHLNKKVTMAFVIDTSSSMQNDMGKVREYIKQLMLEQKKAGVDAEFIVTTFADDPADIRMFSKSQEVMDYIGSLSPTVGGDCEERTCYGILYTIYRSNFMRVRNSAMYVFTDATSKDCARYSSTISRNLVYLKAPVFFILFDSCKPTIDNHYVQMAYKTGGFSLLLKESGVYNITDTVNGAFDKDALICGEESDNALSVVGQGSSENNGRRKRSSGEDVLEKSLLVDTSMEKFKVMATITPPALLNKIRLEKPVDGDAERCGNLNTGISNVDIAESVADNSVVFDVTTQSCPCTGEWKLKYPVEAESFTYSVKSSGEYLVSFEAYFVDQTGPNSIANYAPCLGIEENLVIKLNQGEKVKTDSLFAKIVGAAGNKVHWKGSLAADKQAENAFVVALTIPPDMGSAGFRVVLEGEIVDGTKFQRVSSSYFYPTGSCLRVTDVGNFYALTPNRKTYIKVQVTNNNDYEDVYLLSCSNTQNYDVNIGFPRVISVGKKYNKRGRSNPVVLKPSQAAEFTVNIASPRATKNGRIVSVTCRVTTSTEDLIEIVRLTELTDRFDGYSYRG